MRVKLICGVLLTLTINLLASSPTVGQNIRTNTVEFGNRTATLKAALKQLEEETGMPIFYPTEIVDRYSAPVLSPQKRTIAETLDLLLDNKPLGYSQRGKNIVLFERKTTSERKAPPMQPRKASGLVTNVSGTPLAGVSVYIRDWESLPADFHGTSSTVTDANGHWSLVLPVKEVTVVFSFIGYRKQEVSSLALLNRSTPLRLESVEGSLEEVVVVGYGTTTRRLNTGSVSSITSKDIVSQPVGNPLAALSGRMSGVLIAQNNGVPGSAVQIQIRNQSSLSGTTSGSIPLYVIDGVPFTNFNGGIPATDNLNSMGISGSAGGVSPFSMINPADIERIDVLKDADATAIYGSRGANGVVLITTKKGQTGRTHIGVNLNSGISRVNRYIPMLNLEEYLDLRREAFANDGITPNTTNAPDLTLWDQDKSTDWQRLLIGNTGHVNEVQANLSGGNDQTRFFFNSAYRRESTVFHGDNMNARFSSRLNLDHRSADGKFNAVFSVSYANDNTDMPSSDITSAYNLPPNYPLYDAEGRYYWLTGSGINNPLAVLDRRYVGTTNNLISSANLSYKILPGLTAKTNFGYTITNMDQNNRTPASTLNPANGPTSSSNFSDTKAQNWIIEPTVDYVTRIAEGTLTALVGTSFQQNSSETKNIYASNYSNESLLGSLAAAGNSTLSNNLVYYRYNAVFGKLNYDWKNKYLINATFRRDGSSRFGPNNRFGNFGAIGLGWVFSAEKFVADNLPFLSFGKVRGSFGTTGNDQISNYIYLPLYSSSTPYLGNATMNLVTLPNQSIQWETTKKLEFALDLGFLNDRLLFTANYFRNRSGDQITYTSVATQAGYNSYTTNLPALIQNNGLELELNTTNIATTRFTWKTSANFTFYKNKLLEFPGLEQSFYASSYVVGEPINLIRLYRYNGVNPETGEAEYEDRDKNGIIDMDDRYIADIGTPFYGGFNNTFSYKGFELGVFFQFHHRFGVTHILNTRPGAMVNQNDYWLQRWTKDNKSSSTPGASATAGSPIYTSYNLYTNSDAVYGDASYIKLRSANFSYTLPEQWGSRLRMSNCRIFVQGQNLFTWAKNRYVFDTETTVQGGPSGLGTGTLGQVLPPLRTVVFGINCQF